MINKKTILSEDMVIKSVTCDICKMEVLADNPLELQEFHHINFIGGFNSIFGDGDEVSCDICQHCLKEKLGDYLRLTFEEEIKTGY